MEDLLDNFVFTNELESRLRFIDAHPSRMPKFATFFGEPGTGKTTFARRWAERHGGDTGYFAVNESGMTESVFGEIRSRLKSNSLFLDESKSIGRVIVIDEFHNLRINAQDRFKTIFDDLPEDVRMIFILNTDSRRSRGQLHDIVSSAMYSRMTRFSFDIPLRLLDQVVEKAKRKYPTLSEGVIRATLPDFRQLNQKAEIATWSEGSAA